MCELDNGEKGPKDGEEGQRDVGTVRRGEEQR